MMNNEQKPFFTIITSTLNVIDTIERCVNSVASQTFRNYEHIVVDGASADGTVEFLNSKRHLFSVLISEPDTGIYNAWNKALKHVSGEWVLFLGADDILADDNVLADVAKFIEGNGVESGIVYGDVMLLSKGGYKELTVSSVRPEELEKEKGYPVLPCHSGVFHHHSLLAKHGPYDESYKISADAKLLMGALRYGKEKAFRLPQVIYKMTVGGVSSAGLNLFGENLRMIKELEILVLRREIFFKFCNLYGHVMNEKLFGERVAYKIRSFVRAIKARF